MDTGIQHESAPDVRVIVAFDEAFYAYQGALASAIRILRPNAEVITVEPEKVSVAVGCLCPDVVIGSPLKVNDVEDVPVWVELSLDPVQSSKVSVNGSEKEIVNPTLDKLLLLIEEVVPLS